MRTHRTPFVIAVAAALTLFVAGGVAYPLYDMQQYAWIRADFRKALEADFRNPTCEDYATRPLSNVPQPDHNREGGNCWHLFTSRGLWPDHVPYTIEKYDRGQRNELIERLVRSAQWAAIVALVSGVLAYLLSLLTLRVALGGSRTP